MSAHTPGPWSMRLDRDHNARGVEGLLGDEVVNVVNWNGIARPTTRRGQANARLIASAPELLAALRQCADRLAIHMVHTEDLVAHMGALSAIAKAEGRA